MKIERKAPEKVAKTMTEARSFSNIAKKKKKGTPSPKKPPPNSLKK